MVWILYILYWYDTIDTYVNLYKYFVHFKNTVPYRTLIYIPYRMLKDNLH
jgi:hypothetical protein